MNTNLAFIVLYGFMMAENSGNFAEYLGQSYDCLTSKPMVLKNETVNHTEIPDGPDFKRRSSESIPTRYHPYSNFSGYTQTYQQFSGNFNDPCSKFQHCTVDSMYTVNQQQSHDFLRSNSVLNLANTNSNNNALNCCCYAESSAVTYSTNQVC